MTRSCSTVPYTHEKDAFPAVPKGLLQLINEANKPVGARQKRRLAFARTITAATVGCRFEPGGGLMSVAVAVTAGGGGGAGAR